MRRFSLRLTRPLTLAACLGLLPAALPQAQAADKIKIGFLSTLSGPGAALGVDIRDGFMLAIKLAGNKMGNLPVEVVMADDQQKADVGLQAATKLMQSDKVDLMTGMVFSNVLLPVVPQVLPNMVYISPNTGPAEFAGAKCNPNFFVSSWQNEDIPAAMGKYVSERGFKNVYLLGANYAGGRESITGFKRLYKGKIAAEIYTPLGQLDYASEIAAIAAAKPDALFVFLPGGMGINFIKQFAGSGLSGSVQLMLPGFSADEDTLKPTGNTLLGTFNSSHWAHDLPNEANKKFVAEFEKAYGRLPSLYAAQGYDTALMIDSAVTKVKGRIEDKDALRKALKAMDFASVRGPVKLNRNNYPIQDYYLRVVHRDAKGRITNRTMGKILEKHPDAFVAECKM